MKKCTACILVIQTASRSLKFFVTMSDYLVGCTYLMYNR